MTSMDDCKLLCSNVLAYKGTVLSLDPDEVVDVKFEVGSWARRGPEGEIISGRPTLSLRLEFEEGSAGPVWRDKE